MMTIIHQAGGVKDSKNYRFANTASCPEEPAMFTEGTCPSRRAALASEQASSGHKVLIAIPALCAGESLRSKDIYSRVQSEIIINGLSDGATHFLRYDDRNQPPKIGVAELKATKVSM
jgi:hypothetical protein